MKIETEGTTNQLAFDATGEYLSICSGKNLTIIQLEIRDEVFSFEADKNYCYSASWSPDNRFFILVTVFGPDGYGGNIRIYKLGNKAL